MPLVLLDLLEMQQRMELIRIMLLMSLLLKEHGSHGLLRIEANAILSLDIFYFSAPNFFLISAVFNSRMLE